MTERLRKIIDVACSRQKAGLVLKNCKIVCVFTGEIFEGDIAIEDGVIAAIGSTVAHDSHNLIVIGDSDKDIMAAAKELIRCEGGITVCSEGRALKTLPLPVAGLMSDRGIREVAADLAEMLRICREHGVAEGMDPFMTLSFLSLPVIPELKLTARGLFDVSRFEFTPIEA